MLGDIFEHIVTAGWKFSGGASHIHTIFHVLHDSFPLSNLNSSFLNESAWTSKGASVFACRKNFGPSSDQNLPRGQENYTQNNTHQSNDFIASFPLFAQTFFLFFPPKEDLLSTNYIYLFSEVKLQPASHLSCAAEPQPQHLEGAEGRSPPSKTEFTES